MSSQSINQSFLVHPDHFSVPCDKMSSQISTQIANQFPILNIDTSTDLMTQLFHLRRTNDINSQVAIDTDHAIFKVQSTLHEFTRQQSRKIVQQIQNGHVDVSLLKPNQFFSTTLFDKPFYWTPLHCACYYGKLNVIRQLLDIGYDIHLRDQWYGSFPLAWAAYNNHVDICQFLISQNANILQCNYFQQSAFDMASNPLHPKWYFLYPSTPSPKVLSCLDILQLLKNQDSKLELFMELPDRDIYPDYYQIITAPLSIKQVELKLFNLIKHQHLYAVESFTSDVLSIFNNAFTYNQEYSAIYKDALSLQFIFISQLHDKLQIDVLSKCQYTWESTPSIEIKGLMINCNSYVQLDSEQQLTPDKPQTAPLIMHITHIIDNTIKGTIFITPDVHASILPNECILTPHALTVPTSAIIGQCWVMTSAEYTQYSHSTHPLFFSDFRLTYGNDFIQIGQESMKSFTMPFYEMQLRPSPTPIIRTPITPPVNESQASTALRASNHPTPSSTTYGSYLSNNTAKKDGWSMAECSKMMGIPPSQLKQLLKPLNPPDVLKFSQNAVEMLLKNKSISQLQIIVNHNIGHVRVKSTLGSLPDNPTTYQQSFSAYHNYKPQHTPTNYQYKQYTQPQVTNFKYHQKQPPPMKPQPMATSSQPISIPELQDMSMLQNILLDCGENAELLEIEVGDQHHYSVQVHSDSVNVAPVINQRFYELLKTTSDTSPFRQRVNFDFVQYYVEVTLNGVKLVSHMVDVERSMLGTEKTEEIKETLPNLVYYPAELEYGSNIFEFKTVFKVFDYENVEQQQRGLNKSDSAMNLEQANVNIATRPVFRYQNEQSYYIVANR